MSLFYCCKLRTFVVWISAMFFVFQTLLLAATLWLAVSDVGEKVGATIDWLERRALEAEDHAAASQFRDARADIVRRSYDFLAIPVTACIVLLISDALLLWSASSKQHRVLLWPWLVLHAIEWLAAAAFIVFAIVVVPKTYLKVLVFLICCPFLVVLGFCWIVVKCFFNFLRDLNTKEAVAKVYTNYESKQYPLPATVYSTSSDPGQQVWDQPLPIWASSANSMANGSAWDHAHQLEPRYSAVGPSSLPPLYSTNPYYRSAGGGSRSVASSRRSRLNPTMLPDGTLVVPLADEDDERNTIEEEDEDDDSTIASPPPPLPTYNRRHLVNNYRKRPLRQARSLMSDDGTTSVVSLSDKYRQQDEVEVFEEFYPVPVVTKVESNHASNIPINSTKAAADAGKRSNGNLDSPKTQSTVASEDR